MREIPHSPWRIHHFLPVDATGWMRHSRLNVEINSLVDQLFSYLSFFWQPPSDSQCMWQCKECSLELASRRLEIVEQRPMIGEFKNRWPALFKESKVNDEFLRITTKQLQSKFMSQFDHFSEKLIQIFKKKAGVKGKRIKDVLAIKDLCDDIDTRRECILKSVSIYLNEDPDSFFKEYLASATEDA